MTYEPPTQPVYGIPKVLVRLLAALPDMEREPGDPVNLKIDVSYMLCDRQTGGCYPAPNPKKGTVKLYRDNAVIASWVHAENMPWVDFIDRPSGGKHTYYFTYERNNPARVIPLVVAVQPCGPSANLCFWEDPKWMPIIEYGDIVARAAIAKKVPELTRVGRGTVIGRRKESPYKKYISQPADIFMNPKNGIIYAKTDTGWFISPYPVFAEIHIDNNKYSCEPLPYEIVTRATVYTVEPGTHDIAVAIDGDTIAERTLEVDEAVRYVGTTIWTGPDGLLLRCSVYR